MTTDLRFERTEENIRTAFLGLLENEDYAKLSVTTICREARCSRNAFYQHYESKDHLYKAIVGEVIAAIEDSCQPVVEHLEEIGEAESRLFTNQILEAVYQKRELIRRLLQVSPLTFSYQLRQMFIDGNLLSAQLFAQESVNHSYIYYLSGAFASFVEYWLLHTADDLEKAQNILHQHTFWGFNSQGSDC
ncbi:TetR/AcrR family transcriptional regulator [Streptococcus ovuberis]|uniref:TetR/AcrR family transcriptional regulator n=1 Tax=Streptococcus ovuberis TaxID=1936207 RepID=A0A7X6S195_9STRE|nr:TetR/AcrR family transcriptional regulator [Streptococcus ovuberis]NKZ20567.1 TetR/AcrR family transcriptional regulator [Streptococcus ovuberis]